MKYYNVFTKANLPSIANPVHQTTATLNCRLSLWRVERTYKPLAQVLHLPDNPARSGQGLLEVFVTWQAFKHPLKRKMWPVHPNVRQRRVCTSHKLSVDNFLQPFAIAEPLQQGRQPVRLRIMREVHAVDVPKCLPAIGRASCRERVYVLV